MTNYIAGKYEIIKPLGEGCSGTVYLVKHRELDILYALKLLNSYLSHDTSFIERFKREASVLERFAHPGTVRLRDFGRTEEGLYYMTMDYCPGYLLKEPLEQGYHFSVDETLEIMMQVLDTLEAAHHVGVIHRDIKPENIMLEEREDGTKFARILDFGIAKIRSEMEVTGSVTIVGASLGTPQYMSPEQANGEVMIDHRADIYSAGILMYELLTGRVPFLGKNVVQTLLMHVMRDPDPFDPSLNIPPLVQDIVFRALRKEPSDRYQSAADFRSSCAMALTAKVQQGKVPEAAPVNPLPSESQTHLQATSRQSGKPRILYLDDDQVLLNIVKFMMETQGFELLTSTNPSEVHRYIFDNELDLLITDVNMPGIPGTKVCSMIKEVLPELKIVLFSNLDERDLARSCNECNADGWISKNWKPDVWISRVRDLVEGGGSESSAFGAYIR